MRHNQHLLHRLRRDHHTIPDHVRTLADRFSGEDGGFNITSWHFTTAWHFQDSIKLYQIVTVETQESLKRRLDSATSALSAESILFKAVVVVAFGNRQNDESRWREFG